MTSFSSIRPSLLSPFHLMCKMSWMLPWGRHRHVLHIHCYKNLSNFVPFSNIPMCVYYTPKLDAGKTHTRTPLPCQEGAIWTPVNGWELWKFRKSCCTWTNTMWCHATDREISSDLNCVLGEGQSELISSQYSIIFSRLVEQDGHFTDPLPAAPFLFFSCSRASQF